MQTELKPCEYCGHPLPKGVDKNTRRIRSAHFDIHTQERRKAEAAEVQNSFAGVTVWVGGKNVTLHMSENEYLCAGSETLVFYAKHAIKEATK